MNLKNYQYRAFKREVFGMVGWKPVRKETKNV